MSAQLLSPQFIAEESSTPLFRPGTPGVDWLGRKWVYIQASVALAQGEAVERVSDVIDAVVDAIAAVNTVRVTGTGDFTTAVLVDMMPDTENGHTYYLWINDVAAQGQGGPIFKRVSDNQVDVYWITSNDGKIATALAATSEYIVFTFTRVKKSATANATRILGFVQRQGGITDEYWFWALQKGLGVGLLDTSGTAVTKDLPIVAGDVAGTIQGGDASAADAYYIGGYGVIDSDADALIPIIADCPPIPGPNVPPTLTAAYPAQR